MKDSSAMENAEYAKRTGDKTGDFASMSKRKSGGASADSKRKEEKRTEKKR